MSKFIRLVLLVFLVTGLTACGQKGPLRRPEASNLAAVIITAAPTIR